MCHDKEERLVTLEQHACLATVKVCEAFGNVQRNVSPSIPPLQLTLAVLLNVLEEIAIGHILHD